LDVITMSARRVPDGLRIMTTGAPAVVADHAGVAGGVGLDFADVPGVLDGAGRDEWTRLAGVFAGQPVRFREADRAALLAYCVYFSAFTRAAADVVARGPVVPGRSTRDGGRAVKNPAAVAMRDAATQLRYWARELGLTPDSRGRSGIADDPMPARYDNPFAG
jgi:P27 family predicted phage terminase small subunit